MAYYGYLAFNKIIGSGGYTSTTAKTATEKGGTFSYTLPSGAEPTEMPEGCTFWGWCKSDTENIPSFFTGDEYSIVCSSSTKDKPTRNDIYACYKQIWYGRIIFDPNNGTSGSQTKSYVNPSDQETKGVQKINGSFEYKLNQTRWDALTPTRDDYRFIGWADKADATEADYVLNKSITVPTTWEKSTGHAETEATKTVYAVWQKIYYGRIKYNLNEGSMTREYSDWVNSTAKGGTYVWTIPTTDIPTKTGYKFLGWSTNSSGSDPLINAKEDIGIPCTYEKKKSDGFTTTLHAVWGHTYYARITYINCLTNKTLKTSTTYEADLRPGGGTYSTQQSYKIDNYDTNTTFSGWTTNIDTSQVDYGYNSAIILNYTSTNKNNPTNNNVYVVWKRPMNGVLHLYDVYGGTETSTISINKAPIYGTKPTTGIYYRKFVNNDIPSGMGLEFLYWADISGNTYKTGDKFPIEVVYNSTTGSEAWACWDYGGILNMSYGGSSTYNSITVLLSRDITQNPRQVKVVCQGKETWKEVPAGINSVSVTVSGLSPLTAYTINGYLYKADKSAVISESSIVLITRANFNWEKTSNKVMGQPFDITANDWGNAIETLETKLELNGKVGVWTPRYFNPDDPFLVKYFNEFIKNLKLIRETTISNNLQPKAVCYASYFNDIKKFINDDNNTTPVG